LISDADKHWFCLTDSEEWPPDIVQGAGDDAQEQDDRDAQSTDSGICQTLTSPQE